ncbi:dihydrolipoamide acetyltransferase family protein [Sphingobacterium psychroaquaticum]|uniref:Dihydrolipoamide acetyltransferase component of pyruvate dehydrogenase complex n=1 Tax=Sphingobacterium psychroaquaticum TaxID=561061 RepID=A0A1X7KQN2_9SPHI|nr:dihydrolipoamide acetyltransferase family protein [Sphingobacterium psychroaquaticum]QBQ40554.1 2-oxo acid dehydrogenase subunit E2 [Sphingobacterium psychroaquaticum]SMG43486.1 2-oxoglutarate dehydrogenase E2 component (dihydrolipoamide succinyltransferase) [Sphingobacterium psychroaquaticum]
MGIYKLLLPKMGESVSEATITRWLKEVGDVIEEDESVIEVATDKVDSDVPSPVGGRLVKKIFAENEVAQVGDIIAHIEVDGMDSSEETAANVPAVAKEEVPVAQSTFVEEGADETVTEELVIPGTELLKEDVSTPTTIHSTNRFYSPLVKNIAQEEGLSQAELDGVSGTGADGRVTKQDILNYIQQRAQSQGIVKADKPVVQSPVDNSVAQRIAQPAAETVKPVVSGGDEIIEMDRMRRLIADHMVQSVKTSPHVASFVEADVTNIVNWRNKVKDSYKKREGENITFTPIFIEAVSKALKDFPMVNVSVDGHHIIKRKNINIGMAAALPTGNLIVPVIKNADQLSLVGLSKSVNDLATRARANQLKPDDIQGATFTFTNIGAFGNIMGVPIINQPQAAIIAVGTIKKRPAVLETEHGDVIAIRHMMYISMSYDHRVIDGALGGTFLKRVADYLEDWDINRDI